MRAPWARIPSLKNVIALNEITCSAAGTLPSAPVRGIALVTSHLSDIEARKAVCDVETSTGLPTTDVVRFGPKRLLAAILRDN